MLGLFGFTSSSWCKCFPPSVVDALNMWSNVYIFVDRVGHNRKLSNCIATCVGINESICISSQLVIQKKKNKLSHAFYLFSHYSLFEFFHHLLGIKNIKLEWIRNLV